MRKEGRGGGLRRAVLENRDRPAPRQFLRVVDLAQVQHVPLRHASPGDPRVLDNAPVAVLLAILPANFAAQEHDGRQLSAHSRPSEYTRAALQPIFDVLTHYPPCRAITCLPT